MALLFHCQKGVATTRRGVILARLPSSLSSLFHVSLASTLSLSLSRSVFSSLFLFVPFFSSFLLPLPFFSFSLSFLSLLLLSLFFQIRLARVLSRHPETKKGDSYSQVIQNREKRPESVNFTPRGASGRRYSGHNLHPDFSFEKLDLSRGQDPVKNLPSLSS